MAHGKGSIEKTEEKGRHDGKKTATGSEKHVHRNRLAGSALRERAGKGSGSGIINPQKETDNRMKRKGSPNAPRKDSVVPCKELKKMDLGTCPKGINGCLCLEVKARAAEQKLKPNLKYFMVPKPIVPIGNDFFGGDEQHWTLHTLQSLEKLLLVVFPSVLLELVWGYLGFDNRVDMERKVLWKRKMDMSLWCILHFIGLSSTTVLTKERIQAIQAVTGSEPTIRFHDVYF